MEQEVSMLTTIDNPYNPFTQPDEWYAYDRYLGHYTPEYLARIYIDADGLSPADEEVEMERAINEIVSLNYNGLYCRVTRETFDDLIASRFKSRSSKKEKENISS